MRSRQPAMASWRCSTIPIAPCVARPPCSTSPRRAGSPPSGGAHRRGGAAGRRRARDRSPCRRSHPRPRRARPGPVSGPSGICWPAPASSSPTSASSSCVVSRAKGPRRPWSAGGLTVKWLERHAWWDPAVHDRHAGHLRRGRRGGRTGCGSCDPSWTHRHDAGKDSRPRERRPTGCSTSSPRVNGNSLVLTGLFGTAILPCHDSARPALGVVDDVGFFQMWQWRALRSSASPASDRPAPTPAARTRRSRRPCRGDPAGRAPRFLRR